MPESSWSRPTPTEALDQIVSQAVRPYVPESLSWDPAVYTCLCCGAKGGYDTMTHDLRCPLRVLRETIAELEVSTDAAVTSIDVPVAHAIGTRVRWYGGRTRREWTGLIKAVHQQPGWPAEYDVQVLWKDGRPGAQSQRRHHSELERIPDAPTA